MSTVTLFRRIAFGVALLLAAGVFVAPYILGASPAPAAPAASGPAAKTETATFGMGCFWCSQALFEKFRGITGTVVGYAGGQTENPTYEDVCSDQTGHAECIQITFDPTKISYQQLLDIFWTCMIPPR